MRPSRGEVGVSTILDPSLGGLLLCLVHVVEDGGHVLP